MNPATVQYNRISRSTREAHRICWNRGRLIENQLFELLSLLDPDPEQPNWTNRMRPTITERGPADENCSHMGTLETRVQQPNNPWIISQLFDVLVLINHCNMPTL